MTQSTWYLLRLSWVEDVEEYGGVKGHYVVEDSFHPAVERITDKEDEWILFADWEGQQYIRMHTTLNAADTLKAVQSLLPPEITVADLYERVYSD